MPTIWCYWWIIIYVERFMKEDDEVAAEKRKLEDKRRKLALKLKLKEDKRHRKEEAKKLMLDSLVGTIYHHHLWYSGTAADIELIGAWICWYHHPWLSFHNAIVSVNRYYYCWWCCRYLWTIIVEWWRCLVDCLQGETMECSEDTASRWNSYWYYR